MSRKGALGFDAHYQSVYGDRWPNLKAALLEDVRQVARINEFADRAQVDQRAAGFEPKDFAGKKAFVLTAHKRIEPLVDKNGLLDFYIMDPASIFAAAALEPLEGEDILDLCAAPGGKTLILFEALLKESNENGSSGGSLVANEMSDRRRARLRAVIEDYVPEGQRKRMRVSGHDGARWCLHETESFDRILVDAPCSGERHLLANSDEMKLWSPARSKNLAVRQYALLASAHAVVKHGGRIVYSTCSISNFENDAVIARLLKKREGEVRVRQLEFEIGEPTEHGWSIAPDKTGFGPIYISSIERI